jgi:hypothetical protein
VEPQIAVTPIQRPQPSSLHITQPRDREPRPFSTDIHLMRSAGASPVWEALAKQRPAGQHSLYRALNTEDLLTDRAPAGSPVTGLLMGCRARFGVST